MSSPTADVSCRIAWSADAPAIADVQVRTWRRTYANLLPADLLDQLDAEAFTARWDESMTKPVDARNRVLIALERAAVRGYAVTGPSPDPDADPVADGEILDLVVDPDATGQGHGSRLLQAAADTLRSDKFTRATIWVASADDVMRTFVTSAGWAPDGAHRGLDLTGDGSVTVKQVRLHTAL